MCVYVCVYVCNLTSSSCCCCCCYRLQQDYSFYDLIVTRARGKSGPLWNWDVHDDVRVLADATKEKDESHAAKVVERRWYERNKHIFPASRWEVYDPNVTRDRYTIHGD